MLKDRKKNGQIWIETVVYTLIILSIIGVILGIIRPAINERKDALLVTQSMDLLNTIDGKIDEVKYVAGNSRNLDFKISRGELIIDGENDKVMVVIENILYQYGEPGLNLSEGNINILTMKNGKEFSINMSLDYKDKLNITYKGKDVKRFISQAPSYKLSIMNKGEIGNLVNVDFF